MKDIHEKLCQLLFDETRDSVILTTETLKIVKANYSAAILFGGSESSIIGNYLDTIFDSESRQRCKKLMKILNIDGETTNIFITVTDHTGISHEFSTVIRYFSIENSIHGYFLFIMQGTKNKERIYPQKSDSALIVKRLLSGFSDSVVLIDTRDCIICDCNLSTEIMFGYSRDELIGRSPQFLFGDVYFAKKYMEDSRTSCSRSGFHQQKVLCKRKDGSRFMTLTTNLSMFTSRNESQYIVSINRDVTREEKILDNILSYAEQSMKLSQALYESVLPLKAADLSTSLSELGFSDRQIEIATFLKTGDPTKKIADRLKISESSVKSHLTTMYRRLKVFSRVEFVNYLHDHHIRIE